MNKKGWVTTPNLYQEIFQQHTMDNDVIINQKYTYSKEKIKFITTITLNYFSKEILFYV